MSVDIYPARRDDDGYLESAVAYDDELHFINLANGNAAQIFSVLGLSITDEHGDPLGEIDATDLLGRVLVARGLNPADGGIPASVVPGPGATWIDCGRRARYTEDRLADLERVAHYARDNGLLVAWS